MEEVVLKQQIKELKERNKMLQENFDAMYNNFNRLLKVVEEKDKIATDSLKHGERYQVIYDKQLYVAEIMAGEFVLPYTSFPPLRFDQVLVIKKLEAE